MAEAGDQGRSQAPGRRAFLRFAAAAGGASLLSACSGSGNKSAASAGPTAGASTGSPARPAMSTQASAASGPPTSADWAALARDLSGSLIRPGAASRSAGQTVPWPWRNRRRRAGAGSRTGPGPARPSRPRREGPRRCRPGARRCPRIRRYRSWWCSPRRARCSRRCGRSWRCTRRPAWRRLRRPRTAGTRAAPATPGRYPVFPGPRFRFRPSRLAFRSALWALTSTSVSVQSKDVARSQAVGGRRVAPAAGRSVEAGTGQLADVCGYATGEPGRADIALRAAVRRKYS